MPDLFSDAVEAGTLEAAPRPSYRVPTMEEVGRILPLHRDGDALAAVGSFSGCGGSSLGLKMAGFDVRAAIEFIPAAAATYRANFDAEVLQRDIRGIDPAALLDYLGMRRGELDLFEGSPPCSSFSSGGKGEKGWGEVKPYSDTRQRTDDLFDEWVRLLDGLLPRAFVAENVPGMTRGEASLGYVRSVTKRLSALGYSVSAKVLNATHYGVPQDRSRLIFVGLRDDLGRWCEWPSPTAPDPPYSLREALGTVEPDDDHAPFLAESSMEPYAVGRNWRAIVEARRTGREPRWNDSDLKEYFMLTVPDLDRPCPTVTATHAQVGAASVVHPTECRKFTPAELKAISGFPPDFVLTGTREQRCERMGRAVPPPLMAAVGRKLAEALTA